MAVGLSIDVRRGRLLVGGGSAEWWGPMAVAVIFGLTLATVLTLVMVPTLYSIVEDLKSRWSGRRSGRGRGVAAAMLLALAASPGAQALTLEDAWEAAREHNRDLALAQERVRQSEAVLGQAWSLLLPRVSAQGSYTVNQYDMVLDFGEFIPEEFASFFDDMGPQVIEEKEYFSGSATISQQLFNASSFPLLRAARSGRSAAQFDESGAGQRIRAAVTRSYLGLMATREAVVLSDRSLSLASRHEELANRQRDAGLAPERVVVSARLGVSRAARAFAHTQERLVAAELAFSRLTGISEPGELEPLPPPRIPSSLDGAVAMAMASRPEIQAASERERMAYYGQVSKRLTFLPTLEGSFTSIRTENSGFRDENSWWVASLQGNWTLFDGGLRRNQAAEAASLWRMAEISAAELRSLVEDEVRVAWARQLSASRAMDAVREERVLAQENMRLAEAALEAGTATWLEVDAARLALHQARMSGLQEQVNQTLAAVELLVAVGAYSGL
jgi:outer membrane protein TolC